MPSTTKNALVIMMKNPVSGKVKTRLAAEIGAEKALEIYRALLQETAAAALPLQAEVYVFYSDYIELQDIFPPEKCRKYTQCSGHLGERMEYASSIPFKNEYKKVVIIGTDCADLSTTLLDAAFQALDDHDLVIGPANDGGYYLLGMKKWERWIFRNMPWSSEQLMAETKNAIAAHAKTLAELQVLTDIDTLSDLKKSRLATLL